MKEDIKKSEPTTALDGKNECSQFQWHRKPSGWAGAPCPICGCTTKRLRAEHRAVAFGENRTGPWIKRVRTCFGLDFVVETLRE